MASIVPDDRHICLYGGRSQLSTTDSLDSIPAGAPVIILPFYIAKASPTVANIVEMLEGMGQGGGAGGAEAEFMAMFANKDENDEGVEQEKKTQRSEEPKRHMIAIDIEGPLVPTQQVLNVISEYLQMNHRRAFTEVPKPVRESVLETLRPEEAKFLKDKILSVNEHGVPFAAMESSPVNHAEGSTVVGAGGNGASPSIPSPSSGASPSPPLTGAQTTPHHPSTGAVGSAASPTADPMRTRAHLFKLKVLRAALFLQLTPLVAAISGWFAHEMTKLVANNVKATKNAEKLRSFLGVEEDFTDDEKVIIERHTTWPGRN